MSSQSLSPYMSSGYPVAPTVCFVSQIKLEFDVGFVNSGVAREPSAHKLTRKIATYCLIMYEVGGSWVTCLSE